MKTPFATPGPSREALYTRKKTSKVPHGESSLKKPESPTKLGTLNNSAPTAMQVVTPACALRTYGDAGRDPRMRVVSVAYFAAEYDLPEPQGGGDAKYAEHVPIVEIPNKSIKLAFDHRKILTDAVERLRNKISYTPLATQFCPEEFTIAQLRSTYDIIWRDTEKYLAGAKEHDDLRGPASKPFELKSARPHSFQPVAAPVALHLVTQPLKSEAPLAEKTSLSYLMQNEETSYAKLDPGNFQRSVLQVDGFLEPTGKKSSPSTSGGRPAELFTVGNLDQLSPPIRPKKPSK